MDFAARGFCLEDSAERTGGGGEALEERREERSGRRGLAVEESRWRRGGRRGGRGGALVDGRW